MSFVNDLLKDLNDLVNRLQEDNLFLKRGYDEIERENERLKDNEKEMLKVSSIITTSNENTKLKNYIQILEEQLQKYKSNSKVVFEDYDHEVEEDKLCVPATVEVESENIPSNEVEEEELSTSTTDNPNVIDNYIDSLNTDEIYTDLRVFKYKNETYFIDENNILYENHENEIGREVGKRRLNKKTNKYKTILYET